VEKVEAIILDWKGIKGTDKQPLLGILQKINIQIDKC